MKRGNMGEVIILFSILAFGSFGVYLYISSENGAYRKAADAFEDLRGRVEILEEKATQFSELGSELNQLAQEFEDQKSFKTEQVLKFDKPIAVEIKNAVPKNNLSKDEIEAVKNLRAQKKAKLLLKDASKKIKELSK